MSNSVGVASIDSWLPLSVSGNVNDELDDRGVLRGTAGRRQGSFDCERTRGLEVGKPPSSLLLSESGSGADDLEGGRLLGLALPATCQLSGVELRRWGCRAAFSKNMFLDRGHVGIARM